MNKQKALELFEAWWDDYDMRAAFQAARINRKWPDVIVDEGDDDWQLGLYVGWMNAMKARADLAAEREREREREALEALMAIRDYGSTNGKIGISPDEWREKWGAKFGEMEEAEIAEQTLVKLKAENERLRRPTAAEHALMDERLNLQAEVIELRRRVRELVGALCELTTWARDIAGDCDDEQQRENEWNMIDRMDALLAKHRNRRRAMDDVIEVMIRAMTDNGFPGAKQSDVVVAIQAAEKAGWRLVPVDPTEEMMKAGDTAIQDGLLKAKIGCPYGSHPDHASHDVFKPMLQAAPRPWSETSNSAKEKDQ